jgi:two-component system, cell cycle response regulator DivK
VSRRILVVDDNEDNLCIVRDLLTATGYVVLEAETGEAGLTLAQRDRPDLILMDVDLPGMDGYEAARRIRALPALRQVPIVAVTADGVGDDARATAAGCDARVAKPFSPRELLATVRGLVP